LALSVDGFFQVSITTLAPEPPPAAPTVKLENLQVRRALFVRKKPTVES